MSETEFDLSEWIQPDFLKSPSPRLDPLREQPRRSESHAISEHEELSTAQLTDRIQSQESEPFLGQANGSPTDPENPTLSSDSSELTIMGDQDEPRAPYRPRKYYSVTRYLLLQAQAAKASRRPQAS